MNTELSPISSSSRIRRWLPLLLLVVSAGGLAFVLLPERGNERPEPEPSTADALPNADSAVVEDEPASQPEPEWQSEDLADAADNQLKHLVAILDEPSKISSAALSAMVSEDVTTSVLRPVEFDERFRTASLTVRKGINFEAGASVRGAEAFAESLGLMSAPLNAATHIHSKFKIISVEMPSDSEVSTNVIFQRVGDLKEGSFEQDATWACRWKNNGGTDNVLRLQQVKLLDYEEVVDSSSEGHLFSDCTESVFQDEPSFVQQLMPGIDYWRSLIQKQYGVFPFGHHGIAVGDVNNDGLDDLYAGQPAGLPNRLYLQNSNGSVRDVAAEAGVDLLNRTRGVLLVDLDNDGDQDLVAVLEQLIMFMANDGTGKFTEKAAVPTTEPGALSAADYDQDGDLDIFVVNYGDRFRSSPDVYHDSNNGGANMLLRNDGDWKFSDVTIASGVFFNNRSWSFAASWEDYDDDGDLDLYVANDFGRNNLYRNDGAKFTDVAPEAGVEDIAAGMSASWADFDHDGKMDLYVGNMFSSAGLRITGQSRFQQRATAAVRGEFQRHARGNTLFRNTGDGNFEDVSVDAGVTIGRWAWASRFVDINNDSWEDLVVANGFVTGHETKDL